MEYKLTLGKHEGKTLEWLFFKQPKYAKWMYQKGIHRQPHFGEEEGAYFSELYRRATNLGGWCSKCNERPVTRMGLAAYGIRDDVVPVGLYCNECEFYDVAHASYHPPSFFSPYAVKRWEQETLIDQIIRHYIGPGNLTQKKMEAFFGDDGNVVVSLPRFRVHG